MSAAQDIIRALALEPLAIEGGYFRETYRSRETITGSELPPNYPPDARRALAASIYYLLTPDTFSEMHRLPTAEIYHVYLGGPVRMLQLLADGSGQEVLLSTNILGGHQPQVIVPAGAWQGSLLEAGVEFALLGTTMSPGFDFADYERGRRADLVAQYPAHSQLITRLTRE
jgi:predicted cupin superfamily sugar epimerase